MGRLAKIYHKADNPQADWMVFHDQGFGHRRKGQELSRCQETPYRGDFAILEPTAGLTRSQGALLPAARCRGNIFRETLISRFRRLPTAVQGAQHCNPGEPRVAGFAPGNFG
jgi:hypothetical protein